MGQRTEVFYSSSDDQDMIRCPGDVTIDHAPKTNVWLIKCIPPLAVFRPTSRSVSDLLPKLRKLFTVIPSCRNKYHPK